MEQHPDHPSGGPEVRAGAAPETARGTGAVPVLRESALENAEAARAEAEILLRLVEAAAQADAVSAILEPALDAVIDLLMVDRAAILLFDDEDVMRFAAWRGLSAEYRGAVEGHSPWNRDAINPEPLVVSDAQSEPSLARYADLFVRERIGSLAFVPLVHRGALLGKFMVYSREVRTLTARDLRVARTVAGQIAQAVARAASIEAERRALARAERNARQTLRLEAVTARLSRALTVPDVALAIIDEGTAALGAQSGAIWLVESDDDDGRSLRMIRSLGYPPGSRFERLPLSGLTPMGEAVLSGRPVLLASTAEYAQRFPESEARTRGDRHGPMSMACLPLALGGRPLGGVAFVFDHERVFDPDEISFLGILSQHCAQGFERARLVAAERSARREAEAARTRAAFLADASLVLSSSLDCKKTLPEVARLAVPALCDGLVIELLSSDGAAVERAAAFGREVPSAASGDSGRAEPGAGCSRMVVPIVARGQNFGSIRFFAEEPGRFGPAELDLAAQLGRRVGAAIDNARLYDQAVTAVRVRDDFLSIAGHELRTPLTPILIESQMLVRTAASAKPDKVAARADKLVRNSRRMAMLIDELLDVSRISAGRLELDLAPVDLVPLVAEVVARSEEEAGRVGSTIRLSSRGGLEGLWDAMRLDQVVSNLLANAIKYGCGRPIEVEVDGGAGAGDGDRRATIRVRDQGIGIAPEDQPRIFERFERATSSHTVGGLGLGLWIVARIVEAHGGLIEVESSPGAGSLFTVSLPLTS